MFFHVRAAAIRCGPLSPSAPPGKSYGYWKTLKIVGKTCFFACVAEPFPTGAYGVPRALSRKIGMVPAGEAQEKRESQRYHEWQRRSQQRAQCAPASTTNTPFLANRNSKIKNNPRNIAKQWKSLMFSPSKNKNRARNLTVIGNPSKTLQK